MILSDTKRTCVSLQCAESCYTKGVRVSETERKNHLGCGRYFANARVLFDL